MIECSCDQCGWAGSSIEVIPHVQALDVEVTYQLLCPVCLSPRIDTGKGLLAPIVDQLIQQLWSAEGVT